MGHGALRGGERAAVLPRRGRADAGGGPLRAHRHGRPGVVHRRRALRHAGGGLPQRAEPALLDRRVGPGGPDVDAGEAHGHGSLQARGCDGAGRRERARGGLHGRRRAVRLRVQVRLRRHGPRGRRAGRARTQQDAAERG